MNHHFPDKVKFQQYHGEFRSDLEIEDVGIEIKVLRKTAELTRLRGQTILYYKHFNQVVALIFNYNVIDLDSFVQGVNKLYPNKVTVITKKWRLKMVKSARGKKTFLIRACILIL